ncbi:MAG: single-stranded DNA-binding protein [Clostridia bacterium]|nr:single-stranded DNA-binding protein [Clostridia bacterium]
MASFNKVILIGNLVEDPELKMTPSGVPVTNFKIAVGRRFEKEGEQSADFITIVCWRATAEFVTRYFSKGKSILVCGQLQSRSWKDTNGNNRYSLEVVADEASFVERKTESTAPAETPTAPYNTEMQFEPMTDDEELPF